MGLIKDKTIGIICFGIGLMTSLGTKGLSITSKGTGFGPGAFPLVVGIGLMALSLFLVIKSSLFKKEGGQTTKSFKMLSKPFMILFLTSLYIGLILFLGFLVSTILFIFAMTRFFGERSIKINALFSVSLGLLIEVVFVLGLKLPLPTGYVLEILGIG
jgi:putative tricarboxylic transport membrane protein